MSTSAEAVRRAISMIGQGRYKLGSGGYSAARVGDTPWVGDGNRSCDCWGFVSWAFKQPRSGHAGFNAGGSVSDDINCDSAIDDAKRIRSGESGPRAELWTLVCGLQTISQVRDVRAGDIVVWPSVRGPDGKRLRIGHVAIIEVAAEADPTQWSVIQCGSIPQTKPAIKRTSAVSWLRKDYFNSMHNAQWASSVLRLTNDHEDRSR